MYCPSCGSEENHSNQFCRSCGTNLSSVRVLVENSDSFSTSAVSARDEIGRAVAAKIQQTSSSSELSKFAEDVLPEIERFLESPEERKMGRIRAGSMVSLIGLGVTIAFFIVSRIADNDLIFFSALGLVTFFIGLALLINGWFFTVTKTSTLENSDNDQAQLDGFNATTNDLLMPPTARQEFSSVTEHTTKHLKNKKPTSKS